MSIGFSPPPTTDSVNRENTLVQIDQVHHRVHVGQSFEYTAGFQLANAGVGTYLLVTDVSAAVRVHLLTSLTTSGPGQLRFYEGGDRTPSNQVTAFNRNRNSANTPTLKIYSTASSGSTDGTLILGTDFGSGQGSFAQGLVSDWSQEFILKPNKQYRIDIISQANGNNCGIGFSWYEAV